MSFFDSFSGIFPSLTDLIEKHPDVDPDLIFYLFLDASAFLACVLKNNNKKNNNLEDKENDN